MSAPVERRHRDRLVMVVPEAPRGTLFDRMITAVETARTLPVEDVVVTTIAWVYDQPRPVEGGGRP